MGAPLEATSDFVADESNEPAYNPRMIRADRITQGPIGVGTRFDSVMTGPGGASEMTIEFTRFDRPHRIAERVRLSSMDIRSLLLFEPVPRGHPDVGVGPRVQRRPRWLGPLVRPMGDRQEREIWTSLKRFMEGRASHA